MARILRKTKLFTSTNLVNGILTWTHELHTREVSAKWYDKNGLERLTADLFTIVDENNVTLEPGIIDGQNTLQLLYEDTGSLISSDSSLLLSFENQNIIKPMSLNNEDKYNQIAKEVESYELEKLLGYAFYQAISEHPENYDKILLPYQFEDKLKNTVRHRGLLYVLAYLNYAKYVGESYINDTFTGFVQKNRPDSERISTGDIKRLQVENREIGFNAFDLIRQYIELNKVDYPLWNRTSDKKTYTPKFYGIKKTLS